MTAKIPFLKPNLVSRASYAKYLDQIDASRVYSNNGPLCQMFENRVRAEVFEGVGDIVLLNNATTALMLAISQLKKPTGRYALMPSFTFAATPLAAMWCGLEPYFVDIIPGEWSMSHAEVKQALAKLGDDVAIVVPYATFGSAIDLDFYRHLHEHDVPVVVDAAASMGTWADSCQYGKGFPGIVAYSFHATKTFGIGEGGGLYSGTEKTIAELRRASNFGFDDSKSCNTLGLNAKASEYSAAIALATLDVFDKKRKKRLELASAYAEKFAESGLLDLGFELQAIKGAAMFQHLPILVPAGISSNRLYSFLAQSGIESRFYFNPPCHEQPQFSAYNRSSLDETENISRRIINLPFWEEMTEAEVRCVLECVAAGVPYSGSKAENHCLG